MRVLHSFFSRWQNWLGMSLVLLFIVIAIAAPWLSPNDPANPGPLKVVGSVFDRSPKPPGENIPLGTLASQISVYHAVIWGARQALLFGFIVTAMITIIGVLIGTISAYFGGFLNNILMRITDAFLAFPVIAGVVLIQQIATITLDIAGIRFYSQGALMITPSGSIIEVPETLPRLLALLMNIDPILIAFIVFCWMPYARIMNTIVLGTKQEEFIQASRALGAGHFRQIFRHIIPNSIAPIIVLAAKDVGAMVVLQATFVFIGFGESSPWGMILVLGRDWIYNPGGILTYWWVFLPATLAIVLFGIGWNLVGDGINDALNPRTQ